jgi:hypothetical protein
MSSNRFIVIPFGLHWSEVRASDLIVVDGTTGEAIYENEEDKAKAEDARKRYKMDGSLPRHSMEPSATAYRSYFPFLTSARTFPLIIKFNRFTP